MSLILSVWSPRVQTSIQGPNIMMEVFRCLPQALQTNSGVVAQVSKVLFIQRPRHFVIARLSCRLTVTRLTLTATLSNPLNTKCRLLYLKTQFVPRCKHFSSRLKKPISLWCKWHKSEGREVKPTASAGFEPANLGTKGQHATSRPPKTLLCL